MNDAALRMRLRSVDPAPVDATPQTGAVEATAVLKEIERRMGMAPTETPDQRTAIDESRQETMSPPGHPDDLTITPTRHQEGQRRPLLVGLATLALVLVVVAAGIGLANLLGDEDTIAAGGAADDPAATIEAYIDAYNAKDLAAVMVLFTDRSELIGHPYASPATGLIEIRDVQVADMAAAADTDAYEIFNIEVVGDTVTWDHRWVAADGETWCGRRNDAVIEDGKILSWSFATARVATANCT